MKIGFFGTPEIACSCLEGLSGRHEIVFVVSSEDKPAGRSRKMTVCPVKEMACCLSIPVYHPQNLKDPGFAGEIQKHEADIFVVVAFGRIIPREIFDMPPLKTINLHPSLLPLYRGAAPIEWAIINGEKISGITVQLINEKLDAGDILLQREIEIGPDTDAGEFHSLVKEIGPVMLDEAITGLAAAAIVPRPQDEKIATYCGKIDSALSRIKWTHSSSSINNLVRGLSPQRAAHSSFRDKNIKILKTREAYIESEPPVLRPGEIYVYQKKRLIAGTGDGLLEILFLQPETKKVMDALSFINGHRIKAGDALE